MGRRLTLQLLAVLLCGSSWAVGLGEIELDSALNQNFRAIIPVTGSQGFSEYEVLVKLASNEDFARVGVERFFYLTNIQFSVQPDQNGSLQLSLSTSQPISEPYLNFLVEVRWPNGRLLKEFTVLLDPPTFTQKSAAAVVAPGRTDPGGGGRSQANTSASETKFQPARSSTRPRQTARTPTESEQTNETQVAEGQFETLTNRNDTLWKIASSTRPAQTVNVQQTMLALQRLNPRAFIRGNINLLKAGYKLTLPTEADALSLTKSEASDIVGQHEIEWQAYRAGDRLVDRRSGDSSADTSVSAREPKLSAQVDATPQQSQTTPSSAQRDQGELRIVTGGDSQGQSSSGNSNQALNQSLSESAEEVERISRENDELQYRLDRLGELEAQSTKQNEAKTQQIELQDQRIAELQQQLKQSQSGVTPRGKQEESLLDLLTSPLVMVLGAIVLLLAGALVFVSSRARREVNEAYDLIPDEGREADSDDFFTNDRSDPLMTDPKLRNEEDDDDLEEDDEADSEEAEDDDAESIDDIESAQTSDVVGEADIYIAYGRYPQALALLNTAIDADSSRSEVRLKLLEIYAETEDRALFDEHMQILIDTCDDEDTLLQARDIASEFSGGEEILDDVEDSLKEDLEEELEEDFSSELDTDELDPPAIEPAEEDSNDLEDLEFDLELDEELSSDAEETDLQSDEHSSEEAQNSTAEDALELDDDPMALSIDYDLDILEDEESTEDSADSEEADAASDASQSNSATLDESADSSNAGDDLGGDLGIDFDPDEQPTEIREIESGDSATESDAAGESSDAFADGSNEFDLDDLEFELSDTDAELSDADLSDKSGVNAESELDAELENLGISLSSDDDLDADAAEESLDDSGDAFDFLDEQDVSSTKLDLARAYIDMGDEDGAREILAEVIGEGSEAQQTQANELLAQLKGT